MEKFGRDARKRLMDAPRSAPVRATIAAGDAWTEWAYTLRTAPPRGNFTQARHIADLATEAVRRYQRAYRLAGRPVPAEFRVHRKETGAMRDPYMSWTPDPADDQKFEVTMDLLTVARVKRVPLGGEGSFDQTYEWRISPAGPMAFNEVSFEDTDRDEAAQNAVCWVEDHIQMERPDLLED